MRKMKVALWEAAFFFVCMNGGGMKDSLKKGAKNDIILE